MYDTKEERGGIFLVPDWPSLLERFQTTHVPRKRPLSTRCQTALLLFFFYLPFILIRTKFFKAKREKKKGKSLESIERLCILFDIIWILWIRRCKRSIGLVFLLSYPLTNVAVTWHTWCPIDKFSSSERLLLSCLIKPIIICLSVYRELEMYRMSFFFLLTSLLFLYYLISVVERMERKRLRKDLSMEGSVS